MSITKNEAKSLFLSFASAITEDQVKQIIDSSSYAQDSTNWMPLGNNHNNAAMVQNTAGSLGSCMTELATNAIDAVIQREKNELEKNGVNIPASALVSPQKFLEFALGDTYADKKKRDAYANNNIKFLTTESVPGKRMLTVIDQGCGQSAKNFGATFCSVGSGDGNKAKKDWLHGNYGQGSTSANAISGKYGYKMIVSRETQAQDWGFTIIRRSPTQPSKLEYLIAGNSVLEFSAKEIELGLRITGVIEKGEACLSKGSAIKLFDVKFDKGFTGIKRTMGIVLFRPALPIKSIEFSSANEKGKSKGRDSRWLYGQGYEFDKMVAENKCELQEFSLDIPEFGMLYGKMFFIRKQEHINEIMEWFPNNYLEKTKRFFHINNGQVQHTDQDSKISQFFPKAKNNVFFELDLSFFDKEMAKAYLWKADRTAFQTSNEFYQKYDAILNKFLESSDTLKEWALLCKNDELSKFKTGSAKTDDSMKAFFDLYKTRESKQYKANKMLIQSEFASRHVSGKMSIATDNADDDIEVDGKEVPTKFASAHATKETSRKSSVKKLSATLKTDSKKGATNKDGKSSLKIKKAIVNSQGVETEVDVKQLTMSGTDSNGKISFEIYPNDELRANLKVGDSLMVNLSLTTEDGGQTHVLNTDVFFEIIEQLKDVTQKKPRNVFENMLTKLYGTRNGRKHNGKETSVLTEKEGGFSFKSSWYVYHDDGQILLFINLDNEKFQEKFSACKSEDKAQFMRSWEIAILSKITSKYNYWKENGMTDLEDFANSMNIAQDNAWLTEDCILSALHSLKEADNMSKKLAA